MLGLSTSEQECSKCKYWLSVPSPEGNSTGIGKCRRHAPAVALHSEHSFTPMMLSVWPLTVSTDWCGNWKVR